MKTLIVFFFLIISLNFLSQSTQVKDSLNYAIFLLNKGKQFSEAERILLKYQDSIISDTNKIKFYITLSGIKGDLRKKDEAIKYANYSLELSQKNNDFLLSEVESLLGFIHQILGDYKEVIRYKKKVLGTSKYIYVELSNYREIIKAYMELGLMDSALYYSNLALSKYPDIGTKDSISYERLYQIKLLKERCGENDKTKIISLLKDGIENNYLQNDFTNNADIGILYEDIKNYDSALYYYNNTLNIALLNQDTVNIYRAYKLKKRVYETLGDTTQVEKTILSLYNYEGELKSINQEQYRKLISKYKNTEKKGRGDIVYYVLYIISFLFLCFIFVFFFKKSQKKNQNNTTQVTLTKIVEEKIKISLIKIETERLYLNPNFTMAYLEKEIGVNSKYIGAYFKKKEDSLTNYINALRIKNAEERLKNPKDDFSKYTIEKMAVEVGYKTTNTFKKYFNEYSSLSLRR